MIDYIKLKVKRIDPLICENSKEIYMDSINRRRVTSGFSTTLIYKFAALTIRITESNTLIEGSLHKMYNEVYKRESQNYDDFNFDNLNEIINYVCKHLKINANKVIIQNIEYGLNIRTKIAPSKILSQHTIHYKSKPVSMNLDDIKGESAKYYRWQMSNHWIKLYDKGLHFKHRLNLLRLEKKITKSRPLHILGIVTLSDLSDKNLFPKLLDDLINVWNQICVVDYLKGVKGMTYDDRNLFLIMVNPKTYESYQHIEKTAKHRKAMQRLHTKFRLLNNQFKFNTIHNSILKSIKAKAKKMSQNPQYM